MFKFLKIALKVTYTLIYSYFTWVLKYSRNPNKYPLKVRYKKAHETVEKLMNKLNTKLYISNKEIIDKHDVVYYVSNHYSFFDVILHLTLFKHPVRFVGKHELKRIPIIGKAAISADTLLIQRNNLRQEVNVLKEMRRSLLNKETSWLIFPEGTRNKDHSGKISDFKPGSFKLAMETKTPIVPIATYGNFRPLNIRYRHRRYPVQVAYLGPITSEQYEGMTTTQVALKAHQMIQDKINEMKKLDEQLLKR
jgi:1-acyl-sn-glycerol-3-phosphate acyltransferase